MKVYSLNTTINVLQLACKAEGKWGLMISGFPSEIMDGETEILETKKAALWFDFDNPEHKQAFWDGFAIILCDTEEEMKKVYLQTVGDDGPTSLNTYNGTTRLYALTCNPSGEFQSENT